MRKTYETILRKRLHTHLIRTRDALGITQEEMAQRLMMSVRTYVELDHGKSSFGTLSLVLYLLYVCHDPNEVLKELKEALEETLQAV